MAQFSRVLTNPSQERVQKQRQVLLGSICQRHLDHIRHLLSIAVEEPSLERARRPCGCERDILLNVRPFKRLALLSFRRGRYHCRHCE